MTAVFQRQMQRLGGLKFAPATLDTHWEGLSDVTPDELDAAITRAVRDCDEFPSPRQLRAFVNEERRSQRRRPCPHVDRCNGRQQCDIATKLGRPEKAQAS